MKDNEIMISVERPTISPY